MSDPPFGRDRASYKEQRRKAQGNVSKNIKDGNVDDGMFFGTSPTERKDLRETVDKRKVDLDQLDLNAVDREKYTDVEKVGQTLRLIDMAMGADEASQPAKPKPKPRPTPQAKRPARPAARPPARPAPKPKPKPRPAQAKGPARPAKPARPAAKGPARPPAKPKPPAKKSPGSGKGMKISDLGLTVKPRKVGKQPPKKKRPR